MGTHDMCQGVNTFWYCIDKDESNSINSESAGVWKDKIPPHLMSKQTLKDIFSADLRVVHFTTFFLKKPTYSNGNAIKAWVYIRKESPLLCVLNTDGSEKLPMCFIVEAT